MPDFRENLVKILLLFVVITIILTFANAIILSISRTDWILLLFVVITIILTFANAIILSILRNLLRGGKKQK